MEWLAQHFLAEWRVIKDAPLAFFLSVVLFAIGIFVGLNWYYQQQQQTVQLLQISNSELKDDLEKLSSAGNGHSLTSDEKQKMCEAELLREPINVVVPEHVKNLSNEQLKVQAYYISGILNNLASPAFWAEDEDSTNKNLSITERVKRKIIRDKDFDMTFRTKYLFQSMSIFQEVASRVGIKDHYTEQFNNRTINALNVLSLASDTKSYAESLP